MKERIIPNPHNEDFVSQLQVIHEALRGLGDDESVKFDLSKLSFVFPIILLPITSYIHDTKSGYDLDSGHKIESYLNTVCFPDGIDQVSEMERYLARGTSYIPISVLSRGNLDEANKIESLFAGLISDVLNIPPAAKSAVIYPISELVTNIFEHSKAEKGFLFGQYYSQKEFLDISIVDRGRGLSASYIEEFGTKLNDEEAIIEALSGVSTKKSDERGYGLHTSKEMVCKGLKGEFALITGDTMFVATGEEDKVIPLPDFNWKGVIISYRIPKPKEGVDYRKYVE
ncbi:MAG: hypothetical protein WDZ70_01410 [Candidatus Paceibacterota bacterium]